MFSDQFYISLLFGKPPWFNINPICLLQYGAGEETGRYCRWCELIIVVTFCRLESEKEIR